MCPQKNKEIVFINGVCERLKLQEIRVWHLHMEILRNVDSLNVAYIQVLGFGICTLYDLILWLFQVLNEMHHQFSAGMQVCQF